MGCSEGKVNRGLLNDDTVWEGKCGINLASYLSVKITALMPSHRASYFCADKDD